ncbi:hypothetical protein CRUP_036597 [Coryphaenoides rupestris]|nr:hypothetical protein CRUP_036597 [Coryphaenoides rupestris]
MSLLSGTNLEMCAVVYVLSTVTVGYVLTSALLMKRPALLHRRKRGAFVSRHISHRGECYCNAGEDKCMPLLSDVFEAFPNTPVNVDIKVNNDLLIKKVSEMVIKYDREHLTVWGNASNQIAKKCYKEVNHHNQT